ncbi:MAG TPA: UrcA family protein [Caulobacteraceae bacterium]|nr:UrcA family protein [Caulobacteraceae bacterium]
MNTSNARQTASILATLACALAAAAALPTLARAAEDPPSVRVSYADLDLSHDRGRATLERRIDTAVSRICGDRPMDVELGRLVAWSGCRDTAWNGARRQLAGLYAGRGLAQAQIRLPARP